MRYLFSGLMRDTGMPVEGHIESVDVDVAYDMLSGHGVVASSVIPDPKPLNIHEELPDAPEFADALESAMDSSSSQVNFDDLMNEYKGKKVWVIDRDKIRRRVAQVVETALHFASTTGETHEQTQERIRTALHGLFSDNRNLASERNASSVMGMKYNDPAMGSPSARPGGRMTIQTAQQQVQGHVHVPLSQATAAVPAGPVNERLEEQLERLSNIVSQAESVLASMRNASRGFGRGGGEGGGSNRRRTNMKTMSNEQNDVLLTIYKSNVELLKAYKEESKQTATAVAS